VCTANDAMAIAATTQLDDRRIALTMAILQTANASYAIRLKPDATYYPADASCVTHVGSAFRRTDIGGAAWP
jgi:hypothetical protein